MRQIILSMAGRAGGGPILKIYRSIRKTASEANILVVCGRNSRLRWQIEQSQDRRTRTFGYLEDVHRYIAAGRSRGYEARRTFGLRSAGLRVPVLFTSMGCLMPQESGLFNAAIIMILASQQRPLRNWSRLFKRAPSSGDRKRESIPEFYRSSSADLLIERIQPVDVGA